MAILQYVGARYVPKLFDDGNGSMEWKPNTFYEPLTMVTYNNGNYISRSPVSASVGNPADNGKSWAFIGSFNAGLSHLQEVVSDFMLKYNGLSYRRFVLIGDSYAQGWTPDGTFTSWAQILKNTIESLGGKAEIHAAGGAGWIAVGQGSQTFPSLLSAVADKESVTDVIVAGGYNDKEKDVSPSVIESAFSNFPNAVCRYFPVGNTYKDGSIRISLVTGIRTLGSTTGALTDVKAFTVLHRHSLFSSDGIHPVAAGQREIAAYIWNKIVGLESVGPAYIPYTLSNFPNIEYTGYGESFSIRIPTFEFPSEITGMTPIYTKNLSEIDCLFPTNANASSFFQATIRGSEGYRLIPLTVGIESSNVIKITPLLVSSSGFETITGITLAYITGGAVLNLNKYYF